MMKWIYTFALFVSLSAIQVLFAQDKIDVVEIASGYSVPVAIANSGDEYLYIVEKNGVIRIMDTLGNKIPQAFLDIDARVNSQQSERGLLGLVFHPDYANNGYFFVNYTNNSGNTVIARYQRDANDPLLGDASSEEILMTINQPFSNHNGGNVVFGPNGYLYIGTGDGGSGGDPGNRAQNLQETLGKMLRIDVDSDSLYAIPETNPFFGVDTLVQEIWAYGLRNPWKYSFDRLTGDLWIADVGQDAWEEINAVMGEGAPGLNYGWRCREGFEPFNTSGCPDEQAFTPPVYAYAHSGSSCSGSVTGGFVYRGTKNPYFYGKYIFTDYCTGVFRSVELDDEGNAEAEQLANLANGEFTAMGEDASGELYVAGASGKIYQVESLVSAVAEELRADQFRLHPNPASEWFVIESEKPVTCKLRLYDAVGALVYEIQLNGDGKIDCSGLAEGVYLGVVSGEDAARRIGKLVIAR